MLANLLVALSNAPCYFPINTALANNDRITFGALAFVSSASFLSHLVENHKHGMPGIGFSKKVSYFLNRLDVLGCLVVSSRFSYLYFTKYGLSNSPLLDNKLFILASVIPLIFLRISEYDKYNYRLKNVYIITHCIWHVSIFAVMNYFLVKIIY